MGRTVSHSCAGCISMWPLAVTLCSGQAFRVCTHSWGLHIHSLPCSFKSVSLCTTFHYIHEIAMMAEGDGMGSCCVLSLLPGPWRGSGKQCGWWLVGCCPISSHSLLDTDFCHSSFLGTAKSSVLGLLPAETAPEKWDHLPQLCSCPERLDQETKWQINEKVMEWVNLNDPGDPQGQGHLLWELLLLGFSTCTRILAVDIQVIDRQAFLIFLCSPHSVLERNILKRK